jgi:phosphosulfolactate synthase (CoM biosynthesis protein A)
MHARKLGLATAVVAVCAAAFFAGYAWAFQTYYCGTSSSYCTMNETGKGTASTAIRTDNNIHCSFSTCHSDDWYQNSGGTITKFHASNGAQDNYIGSSDGIYVYSWCATTIGYGSNTARCWTDW